MIMECCVPESWTKEHKDRLLSYANYGNQSCESGWAITEKTTTCKNRAGHVHITLTDSAPDTGEANE